MSVVEYAYCRISTPKQNMARQERNILSSYPDAHIVRETYSGTKIYCRKEWNRLYQQIKKDCTDKNVRVIFDSVSRFSRNADEGCALYEELFNMNVELIFLKEPHINTAVYRQALRNQIEIKLNTGNKATDEFVNSIVDALNKYTIDLAKAQVRIAFEQAEKEVQDLHQRTKEGIQTARLNGKQIGAIAGKKLTTKKSIEAKEKIKKYNKDFFGTLNNEETWTLIGISKMSFYKYKKELIDEGNAIET